MGHRNLHRLRKTALSLAAALTILAGCGGNDQPDKPRPVSNDRAAQVVHRLASELRWGCGNVPAIRQAARKVERTQPRMDPRASQIAGRAVRLAQRAVAGCP